VPLWGAIALGTGAVLLIARSGVMGYLAWKAMERRYLLRIISRREAVYAVRMGSRKPS